MTNMRHAVCGLYVVWNRDVHLQAWLNHTCPLGVISDFLDSVGHMTVLEILLLAQLLLIFSLVSAYYYCMNITFPSLICFVVYVDYMSCIRVQAVSAPLPYLHMFLHPADVVPASY